MAMATGYSALGTGYATEAEIKGFLAQYGVDEPTDLDELHKGIVRASRLVDGLVFKSDTEDREELYRYAVNDQVPDRIGAAVALIAVALPQDGTEDVHEREPTAVYAEGAGVEYSPSDSDIQPAKSDDTIMAERMGIPDVRAFQLLRPYLELPDELNQDLRSRSGTLGVNVSSFEDPPLTSFLEN